MRSRFQLDDEAAVITNLEHLAERGELLSGSLLLLLADVHHTIVFAIGVDDVPPDPPQHERVQTLGPFLRRLRADVDVIHGALLVVVRGRCAAGERRRSRLARRVRRHVSDCPSHLSWHLCGRSCGGYQSPSGHLKCGLTRGVLGVV